MGRCSFAFLRLGLLLCAGLCLPLGAQGKAGKAAARPLYLLWDDFLKGFRSYDSSITLRATMNQGSSVPIHFDEIYFDPYNIGGPRTWSVNTPTWDFAVSYYLRPVRPLALTFNFSYNPLQFANPFNTYYETANVSINASFDIGGDMNVSMQLYNNDTHQIPAGRSTAGDVYTITAGDFSGLTTGDYYRRYNRFFLEFKPLKTLTPLEPRFSVDVSQQNLTYPLMNIDGFRDQTAGPGVTVVETLNTLTMSGSLTLRLDNGTTAYASYSQTPYNNTRNNGGGTVNYLQQNWGSYVRFNLNRYTSLTVSLNYSRSLNRGDSLFRTAVWNYDWENNYENTKIYSTYFSERNGDNTQLSFSLNLR